jgi:hypothetical protein
MPANVTGVGLGETRAPSAITIQLVLEVLDREAVLLTRIPEMPLLSTAVDGRSPPSDPVNPL